MIVARSDALTEPRASQPASDGTVAIYLQSVMSGAKTCAPVKAAPAVITFYQKINLFSHKLI